MTDPDDHWHDDDLTGAELAATGLLCAVLIASLIAGAKLAGWW